MNCLAGNEWGRGGGGGGEGGREGSGSYCQ